MDFVDRLKSRKFLLSLLGVFFVLLKAAGVIDPTDDNLWQLIAIVLGYVGVEGSVDLVARWRDAKLAN